jgi:sugar phosphate isomerase/epimerase
VTRRGFLAASAVSAAASAQPPVRTTMGFSPDAFAILRPGRTALELLEKAHSVGAGGTQAGLANFEPAYLKQVRQRAEQLGMYWEVTAALPGDDPTQFEKTVVAAKEAGAECMRSVNLSGRRYETFNSLDQWKTFVQTSMVRMERALRIVEKHKFPLGIENHKDFIVEEFVPILKKFSSEYFGACIDFGNNMSLLEDPMELIEGLAPYVINTHIKDMAVEEYEEGFLLSEVPLGQGVVDLKRAVALLKQKRPSVKFSLDMLTRDPLKITCLTEKYWVTFPERNGKYLARMLSYVRAHKPKKGLTRVAGLDREAQLKLEANILAECVAYAHHELGLRAPA